MYIGLDVHKNLCYATVLDEEGEIVEQKRFLNTPDEISQFVGELSSNDSVAMEASTYWQYIYDALEEAGVSVSLAHPLKTRAIAEARIKTDRVDSEILAQLLRTNFLPKAYIPQKPIREFRAMVRYKAALTRQRTEVKNRIHAMLAKHGIRHGFSDLFGKGGIRFLREIKLSDVDQVILSSELSNLEFLNSELEKISSHIASLAIEVEEIRLLLTIYGIDYFSALLILSEIGDVKRFSSPKKLCSYAGLVPRVSISGNTLRYGKITKQGSRWLRWVLIQVAHIAIRSDGRLRDFYLRLARRKGSKAAIVACARKLLTWIYFMLLRKEPYREEKEELTLHKLRRMKRLAQPYPVREVINVERLISI
jgi:transposase